MKKLFIIYVIAASIGFSSCTGLFGEGQLDMAPVEDINEDKIFSDYAMFRQYADQAYSYMPGHLGRLWNSLVSSMGDESRNTHRSRRHRMPMSRNPFPPACGHEALKSAP